MVSGRMLLTLFLCLVVVNAASAVFCRAGHYYKKNAQTCHACPKGKFMPHDAHQHPECYHCTLPEIHLHEIKVEECTSRSDTVIRCTEGFFRHERGNPLIHRGSCRLCTSCEANGQFLVKKCDEVSDAFCCPKPNMIITGERNEYGRPVCKEPSDQADNRDMVPHNTLKETSEKRSCTGIFRTTGCNRNERMLSYFGNEAVCCEPCPRDTFVAKSTHAESICQPCWNEDGNLRQECVAEGSEDSEISIQDNKISTQDHNISDDTQSQSSRSKDNETGKDEHNDTLYIVIICVEAAFFIIIIVVIVLCFRRKINKLKIMVGKFPLDESEGGE